MATECRDVGMGSVGAGNDAQGSQATNIHCYSTYSTYTPLTEPASGKGAICDEKQSSSRQQRESAESRARTQGHLIHRDAETQSEERDAPVTI